MGIMHFARVSFTNHLSELSLECPIVYTDYLQGFISLVYREGGIPIS